MFHLRFYVFVISSLLSLSSWAKERMTFCMFPPENLCEPEAAHWQYTLCFLLKSQLRHCSELRALPDSAIEFAPDDSVVFAYREIQPRSLEDTGVVRKLGEAIEAKIVIWGSYKCEAQNKALAIRIMRVGSGKVSPVLTGSDSAWFGVVCQVRKQILHELAITPSPEEEGQMDQSFTSSPAALELFSQALEEKNNGSPIAGVEAKLRQAQSLDPHFSAAIEALGAILIAQERWEEGTPVAKRAYAICPSSATAHYELGTLFVFQDLKTLGRDELVEALRLDPDEPRIALKLGVLYSMAGRWEEAISLFERAEKSAPYFPLVHAQLALTHLQRGSIEQARCELRLAEFYDPGNDSQILALLANLCSALHDIAQAVSYYEKLIAGMEHLGVQSPMLQQAKNALRELKPRLAPVYVKAQIPRSFAPGELESLLKQELTPDEFALTSNIFSWNAAMEDWAKRLTAGAQDDLAKANRLFDAVTRHVDLNIRPGYRTAIQVFEKWTDPKASFCCQDYTALFIALARSVGLKAHYAYVSRDYLGQLVCHSCPAVSLGNKMLLVDATYFWFGAPHQEFEVRDDLRALAVYLSQADGIPRKMIATKLSPDDDLPWFELATEYAFQNMPIDAQKTLKRGLKLDSTSWLALHTEGVVDVYAKRASAAVDHLERCLKLGVNHPRTVYFLAFALDMQGDLERARQEYRTYLQGWTESEFANQARERISLINDCIAGRSSLSSSRLFDGISESQTGK